MAGWWFQIFFIFTLKLGEDSQFDPPRNKDGNNGSLDPGNMRLLNIFKLATNFFWPFSPWRKTMVVGFWVRRLCIGIQLSKWFVQDGIFLALGRGETDKGGQLSAAIVKQSLQQEVPKHRARSCRKAGNPAVQETGGHHWSLTVSIAWKCRRGKVYTVLHLFVEDGQCEWMVSASGQLYHENTQPFLPNSGPG